MIGGLGAAIQRHAFTQSVDRRALGKRRFIHAAVVCAVLAAGQAETQTSFTLQYRKRGKRHNHLLFTAIGLSHRDIQIAATASREHIGNFERTRRHGRLVNDVVILADNDLCTVATGDTPDHWGIAAQAFRQHFIIRRQLRTGKRHAVEYVRRGLALTQR